MKISILDAGTLGDDLKDTILKIFGELGEVDARYTTSPDEVKYAVSDSDVVIVNKIKLNHTNLCDAKNLKLICVAATGYDNIETNWCKEHNIAVCNVKGYSTDSVAQLTVSMALMLINRMKEYTDYVRCGNYSRSGVANRLVPVYHEIRGMTWGIVGVGNIGGQVARVAEALGCRVIVNKRTYDERYACTDIDTLCRESDIISVHTPLTDETKNLINKERIALMKKDAIFINVARGAVADEAALCKAMEEGRLGGLGIDVYTSEPLPENHPYMRLANNDRVCLTPHNAWGAYEARVRCLNIMKENINSFFNGEKLNRIV